jgi:hypothetical protein
MERYPGYHQEKKKKRKNREKGGKKKTNKMLYTGILELNLALRGNNMTWSKNGLFFIFLLLIRFPTILKVLSFINKIKMRGAICKSNIFLSELLCAIQ